MIDGTNLCLAILAAGASRRYGDADKLTAKLHGKMLGLHAADTLSAIAFGKAAVITSAADHPCNAGWRAAGLEIIVNRQADSGMASSVALAARVAAASNAQGLLICLADMPYIQLPHIIRMMEHFSLSGQQAVIASRTERRNCPPALFRYAHFDHLASLTGDTGARQLLDQAKFIKASEAELIDIDTPETLKMLNARRY